MLGEEAMLLYYHNLSLFVLYISKICSPYCGCRYFMDPNDDVEDDVQVQGAIVRRLKLMCLLVFLLATLVMYIVVSHKEGRRRGHKRRRATCPFYKHIIHSNHTDCHDQVHMSRVAFFLLAEILREKGSIQDIVNITLEEQLVMFLHTLGYNLRNHKIGHNFGHSGETASQYFHKVLKAILALHKDYLLPPAPTTPMAITVKDRFDPFFKVKIIMTCIFLL